MSGDACFCGLSNFAVSVLVWSKNDVVACSVEVSVLRGCQRRNSFTSDAQDCVVNRGAFCVLA